MYNLEKDTYTCDICGFEEKWDAHDDHRGDIWECEDCYKHFCTSCFIKALGQEEWDRMLGETNSIYCPTCYGKEQIRDYMIFEEETSLRYPFPKRFEHLDNDEIGKIVGACEGRFDTETIYTAIASVIGTV